MWKYINYYLYIFTFYLLYVYILSLKTIATFLLY